MEIHFEIENRCLLKCIHCSSFATNEGMPLQYAEDDIIRFLDSFDEPAEIFLTGGEPLLYPDISSLIHRIQSETKDISIGMFTTGITESKGKAANISALP